MFKIFLSFHKLVIDALEFENKVEISQGKSLELTQSFDNQEIGKT